MVLKMRTNLMDIPEIWREWSMDWIEPAYDKVDGECSNELLYQKKGIF
jgi:hypothetical protein